jgi:hypothetical protein
MRPVSNYVIDSSFFAFEPAIQAASEEKSKLLAKSQEFAKRFRQFSIEFGYSSAEIEEVDADQQGAFIDEIGRSTYSEFTRGVARPLSFSGISCALAQKLGVSEKQASFALALITQGRESAPLRLNFPFQFGDFLGELLNLICQKGGMDQDHLSMRMPSSQSIKIQQKGDKLEISIFVAGDVWDLKAFKSAANYGYFMRVEIDSDLNIHFKSNMARFTDESLQFSKGFDALQGGNGNNFLESSQDEEEMNYVLLRARLAKCLGEENGDLMVELENAEAEANQRLSESEVKSCIALEKQEALVSLARKLFSLRMQVFQAEETGYQPDPNRPILNFVKGKARPLFKSSAQAAQDLVKDSQGEVSVKDIMQLSRQVELYTKVLKAQDEKSFIDAFTETSGNTLALVQDKTKQQKECLGAGKPWGKFLVGSLITLGILAIFAGIGLTVAAAGVPIGIPLVISGLKLLAISIPLLFVGAALHVAAKKVDEKTKDKGVIGDARQACGVFHKKARQLQDFADQDNGNAQGLAKGLQNV